MTKTRKPKKPTSASTDTSIRTEYLPLSVITKAPRNPKDHDLEEIGLSFNRFGFVEPVGKDERTGWLLWGHGRILALEQMKADGQTPPSGIKIRKKDQEWLVPVIRGITTKDEQEAQAYRIASNRLVEKGGWVPDLQLEELQTLMDAGKLEGTGFDDEDVERLLNFSVKSSESEEPESHMDIQAKVICPKCQHKFTPP